jgi:hypothetical protein
MGIQSLEDDTDRKIKYKGVQFWLSQVIDEEAYTDMTKICTQI